MVVKGRFKAFWKVLGGIWWSYQHRRFLRPYYLRKSVIGTSS